MIIPKLEDWRLDAEKMLRRLSDRAQQMFKLRQAGYDWEEGPQYSTRPMGQLAPSSRGK